MPLYFCLTACFQNIEELVNYAGRRDYVEIKYNNEWHYPEYFLFDRGSNFRLVTVDNFIVDPEITHGVLKFQRY